MTADDGDERDEDGEDERHGRDGDRHRIPSSRNICSSSSGSSSCCSSSVHRRNIILPSNTESTPSVAAAAVADVHSHVIYRRSCSANRRHTTTPVRGTPLRWKV